MSFVVIFSNHQSEPSAGSDYQDFKTIINSLGKLGRDGTVFIASPAEYPFNGQYPFTILWISEQRNAYISLPGAYPEPPSFAQDFPDAVRTFSDLNIADINATGFRKTFTRAFNSDNSPNYDIPYQDLKTFINTIDQNGKMYFGTPPSSGPHLQWLSSDRGTFLSTIFPAGMSLPSTFAVDFPQAIGLQGEPNLWHLSVGSQ